MSNPLIRLENYRPPAWIMQTVDLDFDLDVEQTEVRARLNLIQDAAQGDVELRLDGVAIELLELRLDGRLLNPDEYHIDAQSLMIPDARGSAVVETRSRVRPLGNKAMQGIYLSGTIDEGFLLSQCEAEGFRHITWSIDRPDVLARYTVTLRARRERFPILLAGGNPDAVGDLEDGRHWARFVDPQPRPSYLFAAVAGRLGVIEDAHVTAEGRHVSLKVWAQTDVVERCRYAMECLKAAMRWDEQEFGRNYQLDVFHVVATDDFTLGAMENTGLNIFNSKYLLADPLHATDDDYRHVLAVVAHEYFHNWTGNRVTCRDWFQLCLKEGLTVYREQEFVSDLASRTLRRIEDVRTLWRAQFSEDSGPLAHPVRPSEYTEINNFYTATVYDKGAEIVRMLATLLGREGFRRGMDLYFHRHDGQAVTVEDFLAALGDANARDLAPWLVWYTQAGTPQLSVVGSYDAPQRRFDLQISQAVAATPRQEHKRPLPIPIALALFDHDGHRLAIECDGVQGSVSETVLLLEKPTALFSFRNLDSEPVASLLRGYSAPVRSAQSTHWRSLAMLAGHEDDGFNRWLASDSLVRELFVAILQGTESSDAFDGWIASLRAGFDDAGLEAATFAEMLTVADEATLSEAVIKIDPDAMHAARSQLEVSMGSALEGQLLERYQSLVAASNEGMDASAQSRRRLRNRCLALLCTADSTHLALAHRHYRDACCLSDTLAALTCLVHAQDAAAGQVLDDFASRYRDAATVMDRWFMVQATVPDHHTLSKVDALTHHDAFRWDNPNKVYALLLGFALRNPVGFHRADGAGYRFIADAIIRLDQTMPQVSARLATSFGTWQRYENGRRERMRFELARIQNTRSLSADLSDIVRRSLGEDFDEGAQVGRNA